MDKDREHAKEALQHMSKKEKLAHIWRYYRVPFFVTCLVIGIAISLIGNLTFNKRPDGCLQIAVRTQYLSPEDVEALPQYLSEKYPEMMENGEKAFYAEEYKAGYKSFEAEEANIVSQKMEASVAAGTLDVFVGDLETLKSDVNRGIYMDLRNVFTEEELQKIEKLAQPRTGDEEQTGIVYLDYMIGGSYGRVESMQEHIPYLICIAGGDEKVDACVSNRTTYMAIAWTSTNMDNVKTFLWSLLGENVD